MNDTRGALTRQRIIETAAELFHQQGVKATSVDDVLKASSTGKGQFYHYFSNKDNLVREVLQYHVAAFKNNLPDRLESINALEEWLRGIIIQLGGQDCPRACPIGSIGLELTENEVIRKDVETCFLYLRKALETFFTRMVEQKVLEADAATLADFILTVLQGGALVSKVKRDTEPFERALDSAMAYIRLLQR